MHCVGWTERRRPVEQQRTFRPWTGPDGQTRVQTQELTLRNEVEVGEDCTLTVIFHLIRSVNKSCRPSSRSFV